ncbi:prolyl oligopeptidase family serine peptidase [Streptomonospora nanhaiensis]|uniref:Prolyl oligopeptidase family serine peptidase n=1 Tax=Streptomonospora nanhaiensis TaxID=1323731 RepID=A0ABY6YQG4_9ACTN|nr:CocE/NonD family hydrolase [Streptomonospora nanhaiensis]WAE74637.1 prolyl oligopeptidase family serine peptidase [Streptomonospora nanhaiensis]
MRPVRSAPRPAPPEDGGPPAPTAARGPARLLSCAIAAVLAAAVLHPAPASAAVGASVSYETIVSHDGTELSAKVITPTGVEGPHPLLVMPSAWGTPQIIYVGAAARLAMESGYQVVAYTSRGFLDSGGEIEVAGPDDRADAGAVIDWALENTEADPDRIGMAGISYGGGISLLTAAEDDRVRAVASLSGWADLAASLYPDETVNRQAAELLLLAGNLTGRPGEDLSEMEEEYRRGNIRPALDLAPDRSAATKVDALNANGTAVMMAHAWNDGIFPVGHVTDFYEELEGPKRLMLAPGDHATQEAFGALGLPDEVWESLGDWFDHHLRGQENEVDADGPVHVRPNNGSGGWTSHPDWPSVTGGSDEYYLAEPSGDWFRWQSSGAMGTEPATGWDYRFRTGIGTPAESGTVLLSGALQQFFDIPTGVLLPTVDRYRAAVWTSPAYPDGVRVAGTPEATFTFTPTAEDQSVFLHLYAVDGNGAGSLISHTPHTLRGAVPGEPVTVTAELEPVVWDVPAGHRLAVVVDSRDARYTSESALGDRVDVTSPEDAPTRVTVPLA